MTTPELIDGDARLLTADEQALALKLTGRTKLPEKAPREFYVGAGRRSGKSRLARQGPALYTNRCRQPSLFAENAVSVPEVV